jgi:hypothetical protein
MTGKQIAETTLAQLGGAGRLSTMVGAKHFSHDVKGALSFRFAGCKKANHIEITLNGKDLYDIQFYKLGRYEIKKVKEYGDIYADMLQDVIERYTGLCLSL